MREFTPVEVVLLGVAVLFALWSALACYFWWEESRDRRVLLSIIRELQARTEVPASLLHANHGWDRLKRIRNGEYDAIMIFWDQADQMLKDAGK